MFSRDGTRLAIGGGTWYGNGGIVLFNIANALTELSTCAELLSCEPTSVETSVPELRGLCPSNAPTVSGVCFSNDDRHLAASMWRSSHFYEPSALCQVQGLQLQCLTRGTPRGLLDSYDRVAGCPTAVLLYGSGLITRNHIGDPAHVIVTEALPPGIHVAADRPVQQFTHSRMIVARNTIITESGRYRAMYQRRWERSDDDPIVQEGLIARAVFGDAADVIVPVRECDRVTAIALLASQDSFVTGGRDGEIDLWSWDGEWIQRRVQGPQPPPRINWPEIGHVPWVTYTPSSIVALVTLCRSGMWASVTAGGELRIDTQSGSERVWQLPEPGSPRSMAAHPQEPWVAVGLKKGGFQRPDSAVAIIEVD
jgi:hypothetical protein